jgi:hypothetical protein
MSGGIGGGVGRLIDCCPCAKRFIVCIKDCIICLFASFCESIVLMRTYIVCSFADGSRDSIEASTRGIRARDARVSVGDRLRLGVSVIDSLSQISSLLKTGVSGGGLIDCSYDYSISDRDIFSLQRVTVKEDIIISSSSYVFELLKL